MGGQKLPGEKIIGEKNDIGKNVLGKKCAKAEKLPGKMGSRKKFLGKKELDPPLK